MKAICIAIQLSDEQRKAWGAHEVLNPAFQMTLRKEYLVFGVAFFYKSIIYGTVTLFEVEDDAGRCISTPSGLFQITDPRPSKWWIARQDEESFQLWPDEFYTVFSRRSERART